jgi:hypothetical protein
MRIFIAIAHLRQARPAARQQQRDRAGRGHVAEPGFGDRGHQPVRDEEQGGGAPDATPVHHREENQNEQQQRNDGTPEPTLIKVDSEPVVIDRKTVKGLVGQSGSKTWSSDERCKPTISVHTFVRPVSCAASSAD